MGKQQQTLIEQGFPFDQLSAIAEQESWRKEVNRPASYIHKWWARRLGSVFRGLIIGGFETPDADFFEKYYSNTSYQGKVVFDPFMGSGTTVHEAIKLGAKAIGSDINPVAAAIVRAAADTYTRDEVIRVFKQIESNCHDQIRKYYSTYYHGEKVDVLYYFWVKEAVCDDCSTKIPLTRSSVFSKNAYASKNQKRNHSAPIVGISIIFCTMIPIQNAKNATSIIILKVVMFMESIIYVLSAENASVLLTTCAEKARYQQRKCMPRWLLIIMAKNTMWILMIRTCNCMLRPRRHLLNMKLTSLLTRYTPGLILIKSLTINTRTGEKCSTADSFCLLEFSPKRLHLSQI